MVAVEPGGGPGDETLEALAAVLDPVPALTPALLELSRWAAGETASAWGEAAFRALPPGIRSGAPAALAPLPPACPPGPAELVTGRDRGGRVERRIGETLATGGSVLVLAPEIELARAWAARLETRLGEPARLVTSAASPRERWAAWWACRQGQARLAIGTRTAAWLPLAPLGLAVVVDEEDPAHKSPDAPRWHARDLALERVRREGGASLLASPAPSLESWVAARSGALAWDPGARGAWPTVERVTLGAEEAAAASLSPGLREAARAALARGRLRAPRPQPARLRPDADLCGLRHRATLRALPPGASLPSGDAGARVPALRAPGAGGEPLRPLPRPAAPAPRLGHGAARGGGPAGVPRGAGRSIRFDGRPA